MILVFGLLTFTFQSTLPARGATDSRENGKARRKISIHAPREGSDPAQTARTPMRRNFNPRSPRGERHRGRGRQAYCVDFNPRSPRGERLLLAVRLVRAELFQSTLPARGATRYTARPRGGRPYFNPRSPRGERLWTNQGWDELDKFQSTLPARGATSITMTTRTTRIFQSTLPARGATFVVKVARPLTGISIHAPREGSDACKVDTLKELCISIHAPREGSDR